MGGCLRFSYGEEGTTEFYIKKKVDVECHKIVPSWCA